MKSRIALMVIFDGRDQYLDETLASLETSLPGFKGFTDTILIDDSDHQLGFAGAIQEGWRQVIQTDAEHVFHLEQDFTFTRPVLLDRMATVLDAFPYLAQLALRRQPWNDAERAAGGVIERHPDCYLEVQWDGWEWLEHREFFTTNPSLYPVELCEFGWPDGEHSEGMFGLRLCAHDPALRFGYWGARSDPPRVTHIGDRRAGIGY